MLKNIKGVTLLEILFVMMILGWLAGYVDPKYFAQLWKSEIKVTRAQINALDKALDTYRLDTGHYLTTEQGLIALYTKPTNEPKWQRAYLKKAPPADPWGNPYIYKSPSDHAEIDITSYGADG